MESIGYSKDKIVAELGFYNLEDFIASVDASKKYMIRLLYKAFTLRDAMARQKYGEILKIAHKYIGNL